MKNRLFKTLILLFISIFVVSITSCGKKSEDNSSKEVVMTKIKVAAPPSEQTYTEGEVFSTDGLVLMKKMSDGTEVELTDYDYSPKGELSLTDNKVVVTYQDFTLSITITVTEKIKEVTHHFITDVYGNYGGTLNKELYGEGSPLNGEADHTDSEYYHTVDYYNLGSTNTRTLITHFMPYQQTMEDSSGIACLLACLNYDGKDVTTLNEEYLVKRYEQLNGTTVYGSGTTPKGLKALAEDLGYNASISVPRIADASTKAARTEAGSEYIKTNLEEGKFVFVRYQGSNGYQWYLVLGYDDMGDDIVDNDAVILMDPNDRTDHFQDGYLVVTIGRLSRWWNEIHAAGAKTNVGDALTITPKNSIVYTRLSEVSPYQTTIYETHFLDGSAHTWDESNFDYSYYFHMSDVYNMKNTETRKICEEFEVYEQNNSSSCALVSLMVTLNHYGEDIVNTYSEAQLIADYETYILGGVKIDGKGSGFTGRVKLFTEKYGFTMEQNANSRTSTPQFTCYEDFQEFVWKYLSLDMPIPIAWTPIGNHGVTIIGYENMGTENIYDDVVIIADSGDYWDHHVDGYNVIPATTLYNQWFSDVDISLVTSYGYNLVYRKTSQN